MTSNRKKKHYTLSAIFFVLAVLLFSPRYFFDWDVFDLFRILIYYPNDSEWFLSLIYFFIFYIAASASAIVALIFLVRAIITKKEIPRDSTIYPT